MTTLDQRQTTLHRVLKTLHQQDHGDDRKRCTQTDRAKKQQARRLLVPCDPTEQLKQKIHDLYSR
ncbi:hypothetical protein D3C71_2130050 [compost metagenome]